MILVDGPSSVVGDRWIADLDQPDGGVVSVIAKPGSHAMWSLASAILHSFGQREMAMGATENDRRLLSIWVEANGLTDVIVNHAEHYPVEVIVDLDGLLAAIGVRLWLVVEGILIESVLADLGASSLTIERRTWPSHPTGHACECVNTHVRPALLDERFGLGPRRPPNAPTHPWRWRAGRDAPEPESAARRTPARGNATPRRP